MNGFASSRTRRLHAFTLTEILLSIAVLALLVLLVTQLFNSATAVITRGRKGIDADAEARIVFDRMATDFARMIRRTDLDFYGKDTNSSPSRPMTGNDQLAFYSDVRGYYSSPSPTPTPTRNQRNPISLIAYCVSANAAGRPQLVRMAKGLVWESNTGGFQAVSHLPITIASRWPNLFQPLPGYSGMADADFEVISDSVVRFEYCYLLQSNGLTPGTFSTVPYNAALPGHTTSDFCNDVAATVVTIAVLDTTSRIIVTDYSQLVSENLFPDATTTDIALPWINSINQTNFASTARIPQNAASAVHVYQRRFAFSAPPQ